MKLGANCSSCEKLLAVGYRGKDTHFSGTMSLQMNSKDEPEETSKPSGGARILALTVLSAAIGGTFQYGYNISIINAPTSYIQSFINDTYMERWGVGLETPQVTLVWTLIVSAFSLGGWLGALLAGPLAVRCGRKNSLLLNNSFLFVGAVLVLTCRVAKSFEMIILARLLVGMNSGVSMNIQPMYFGESAPKHLRGAVAFSSAVFTAFGIFLGQVVGITGLLGAEPLWPYLLASNALPGLIQLLTLPWFPESPRYLLIDRGDREACVRALRKLRGGEAPVLEMEEMLQEQQQHQNSAASVKTPWSLFKDPDLRSQLRTVMAASSAMMLCGNDSIYFYASYIFLEAGIPPEKIQYVTIGTGASELTASILSNLLIERVGRRYLLLGGYSLMSCWSVVFTVALTLQSRGVAGMAYLSMVCVFAYILSFGLGPAGVTGILPAEIFDQGARPAAYMVAGSCMWISLFLVGMLFPFIVKGLGNFCFLPFMAVCLVSALFLGFTLPETKGKTVAEITAEFDRKNGVKREKPDLHVHEPIREYYQLGKACSFTTLMQDSDPDHKNATEI
ncbi:solute carrier family 2, facilitated glucose transporter member 11-like [Epinephelus fuscoguttatus]|uniref:solute carrier family 2, facilitated glucose transporter member 11-like n=1 Tax=Epinephelus fuscoguttatus TaxID=293821 RepID=UPI0020D0D3B4|nr:solute carrier family 2, facilitated glucose transporter member 11-like [Epinephelus fuscoguttatus]